MYTLMLTTLKQPSAVTSHSTLQLKANIITQRADINNDIPSIKKVFRSVHMQETNFHN